MLRMLCGLTFCGLERLTDGRLWTELRGHGFMAESSRAPGGSPRAMGRSSAPDLVWSHPDAAVLHRRQLGLPQPRRLRVVWMRLNLRAGLALTSEQAAAWGIGPDTALDPCVCEAIWDRLDAASLDALILSADPWKADKDVVDIDPLVPSVDSPGVHKLVVGRRIGSPYAEPIEEWEVVGSSAEFDYSNLARYPAMLRQRHASRWRWADTDTPHTGHRELVAVDPEHDEEIRVFAKKSLRATAPPSPDRRPVGSGR
jgi:hypothetical protein